MVIALDDFHIFFIHYTYIIQALKAKDYTYSAMSSTQYIYMTRNYAWLESSQFNDGKLIHKGRANK